jgi:hypothetical protein
VTGVLGVEKACQEKTMMSKRQYVAFQVMNDKRRDLAGDTNVKKKGLRRKDDEETMRAV